MPFRDPPLPRPRQTLGWAIVSMLLGLMVVGFALWSNLNRLHTDVVRNRQTGYASRAVACQQDIDLHLRLPDACRDPVVLVRLRFGP